MSYAHIIIMALTKKETINIINDKSYINDDNYVVNLDDMLELIEEIYSERQ